MTQDQVSSKKPPESEAVSVQKLRRLFFVSLGLLVALNVFIRPHDPHFGLDAFPGFWALFGLAGAILLGRGAKGLAHTILGKDEDFYDKPN
ncbi:MAG: hypothetical protein AB7S77_12075 [Desulfatirhabdiaceae bacterium]